MFNFSEAWHLLQISSEMAKEEVFLRPNNLVFGMAVGASGGVAAFLRHRLAMHTCHDILGSAHGTARRFWQDSRTKLRGRLRGERHSMRAVAIGASGRGVFSEQNSIGVGDASTLAL